MKWVGPPATDPRDLVPKVFVDTATAPRVEQVEVDFGDVEDTTAYGTGYASWVRADSVIVCTPDPVGGADHNGEEAAVEGVTAVVTYIEPGIGFDIIATCTNGTWGRYLFNCAE